jgi:L-2-hydroxyglutarate oxidase
VREVAKGIWDVAVIGGGIVGMATAMAVKARYDVELLVLEAEERLAPHQTGHNSGVIHSGLYYRPGSLKALNCVRGREAMYEFCAKYGIPHERCGKLVVATSREEIPRLDELERRGRANGLVGLKRLKGGEIRDIEPHASGIEALWVSETGIVDFVEVTHQFARIVRERGGEVLLGHRVVAVNERSGELIIETTKGEFRARGLINCAGLQSDRVARMCGMVPTTKIVPFRGEYYELVPEKSYLLNGLIYPVPDPRLPFLGVHFTRTIHGVREAGPNAVLALKREGYSKGSFSLRDSAETFFYVGFWRLAVRYWRTGLDELYRSFSKAAFVRALRKLMPEITPADLVPGASGVRAQALGRDGSLIDDFVIMEGPKMVHVLNAPSPAATASISIGETIALKAERILDLRASGQGQMVP